MRVIYEQVRRPADASFGTCRISGRAFGAPYHLHPEIELTAILSGHGQRIVGDHFGRFAPGDVVLHGPSLPHAYRADPGGVAPATVFVQFSPEAFGAAFWELPECAPIRSLFARASRGLRFSPAAASNLTKRLENLTTVTGLARLGGLLEALDIAARDRFAEPLAAAGYMPPSNASGMKVAAAVLRALEHSWREELRLETVARAVGMHPQSLSRFCRRRLGRGFSELLVARRLGEVARRLLETDAASPRPLSSADSTICRISTASSASPTVCPRAISGPEPHSAATQRPLGNTPLLRFSSPSAPIPSALRNPVRSATSPPSKPSCAASDKHLPLSRWGLAATRVILRHPIEVVVAREGRRHHYPGRLHCAHTPPVRQQRPALLKTNLRLHSTCHNQPNPVEESDSELSLLDTKTPAQDTDHLASIG